MFLRVVLLVAALALCEASKRLEIHNCHNGAPIQLDSLVIQSSYPIKIGNGVRVTAHGTYDNANYRPSSNTEFRITLDELEGNIVWGWWKSIKGEVESNIKGIACRGKPNCPPYPVKCSELPFCPPTVGNDRQFRLDHVIQGVPDLGIIKHIVPKTLRGKVTVRDDTGKVVACAKLKKVEIKLL